MALRIRLGFLIIVLFLLSCSTDQSIYGIEPEMLTWNLRGTVRDGLSGNGIGNAVVSYIDKEGVIKEVNADSQSGDFFVKSLDPGTYLFSVCANDSGLPYTKTVLQTGVSLIDTGIPLVELAEIVSLFPRNGILKGYVKGRFFENGTEFPISNAQLSVSYIAAKYANNTPTIVTGKSDSLGFFVIDSLPLCDSAILKVENCEYEGELYTSLKDYEVNLLVGDTTPAGIIYMEPVNSSSRFRFIYSNICDVNSWKLYPAIAIDEDLKFVTNKKIKLSEAKLLKNNEQIPIRDTIINDTIIITPVSNLLPATEYSLSLTLIGENGERIDAGGDEEKLTFITDNSIVYVLSSNVLHSDLTGKQNVSLITVPYFIMSSIVDSNDFSVKYMDGNTEINSELKFVNDTIFASPKIAFGYNSEISVLLEGTDINGNKISVTLDGDQKFTTEDEVEAIESNTWTSSKDFVSNFDLYDTLWVRYPLALDTLMTSVKWDNPGVNKKIYGNGNSTNANAWISKDTLFVIPDARIQIGWGDTVGFKVSVSLTDGRKTKNQTFAVITKSQTFSSLWSNTIDDFGNVREDFGLSENVIIKTSHPVLSIDKVNKLNSITLPEDIYKDDFIISNDTIIFIPSLKYKTGTEYGFMLDVTLNNGMKLKNVLATSWETRVPTKIISANTHNSFGIYRPFKVYGDTFSVRFSQPIDSSAAAPIPLKVTLTESNYNYLVNSEVVLDSTFTIATVRILDTLATADVYPSNGYKYNSFETRAVRDVKFDFTTLDGEIVSDLKMYNKYIEIHTEPGLCAINSNILESHKSTAIISKSETARQLFNPDSALYITFNRELDTALINQFEANNFIELNNFNDLSEEISLSFSADLKTVFINTEKKLNPSDRYYLEVRNIPALGINASKAVSDHSGLYNGNGYRERLITDAFNILTPSISEKTANCEYEKINFPNVKDNRIVCSAGDRDYYSMYDEIVGGSFAQTSSSLKFRINECAWNENHNDSVSGYEIQVRKVDRYGNSTQWYNMADKIETRNYNELLTSQLSSFVSVRYENFYTELQTEKITGQAITYYNYASLFNDSSTIQLRVRPYVGISGYTNYRTGTWGESISINDNVAPCDSDFVTTLYCDNSSYGGVYIGEYVNFNNSTENSLTTGYIDVRFPEDMDINGPTPGITFYYGTFGGDTVIQEPLKVINEMAGWYTARTYRAYIEVPPGDYTHGNDGTGAFFNVNVAGCVDLSGNVVDTYGTDGTQAISDLTIEDRIDRADITDQKKGTMSLKEGFILCY